jgi:rhamnosyl/mannosyltransferase
MFGNKKEVRQQQLARDFGLQNSISALHIGKYFPPFTGGMENFLVDLLRTMAGKGVEVAALVHTHVPRLRGEVRNLPVRREVDEGRQVDSSRPIRLYRAPSFGRLLYAPMSPQFPFWLRQAIKTERPDILHLHLPNTSAFWAMSLAEARSIPWVVHWHSDVVASDLDRRLKLAYPLYRPFEQRMLDQARAIIATSPNYLYSSNALAPWRDKTSVVPLGLDPRRIPRVSKEIRQEAERCWGGAEFRILCVGRLTYYKGQEYLIKALKHLPHSRAIIVGEGERREMLRKIIYNLGLGEQVVLTGKLSSEHVYALMASCDCFCLPSLERTEAFGMVLLEAMAHGKPTVVSDIPGSGMSWVVQDGKTGRLVQPANAEALAVALRMLSHDRSAITTLGRAGYRRYRATFSMEQVANDVLELYSKVLQDRCIR